MEDGAAAEQPAAMPDENVSIISSRFVGVWNYRVELPEVVSRERLARALTSAVLLAAVRHITVNPASPAESQQ